MTQHASSSKNSNAEITIRSALFFLNMALSTLIVAPIMISIVIAPFCIRYRLANQWVVYNLRSLKKICRLSYEVEGAENIPDQAGIIFCKHQSAWETIALQQIFPPVVFILKRELLLLPFFGWALATCDPIAIDRKSKKAALRHIIRAGIERLKSGRWVVIFPEGTRVPPGERKKYGIGGALLAEKSGFPVVPVAHNAGEFWGRRSFLKYPGVIQVRIGPVIETHGRRADEINKKAEEWIEGQMALISATSPDK